MDDSRIAHMQLRLGTSTCLSGLEKLPVKGVNALRKRSKVDVSSGF